MTEFTIIKTGKRPYVYQQRTSTLEAQDIALKMGSGLDAVRAFLKENNIRPTGPAMAVYPHFDAHSLTFQAGFPVSQAKAKLARGEIREGLLKPGRTISFRHTGPYSRLREIYAEMMGYMQINGLRLGTPTWEIYEVGPGSAPEEEFVTVVHAALD